MTEPGVSYELRIGFSARPGAANGRVGVYWAGQLMDVLDVKRARRSRARWTYHSYLVVAWDTRTELRLVNLGGSGTQGGVVGEVSVTPYERDEEGATGEGAGRKL